MANTSDGIAVDAANLGEAGARTSDPRPTSIAPPVANDTVIEGIGAEVLSSREFLKQLRIEKRRTDRTQSPLSLVLIRVDSERGGLATVDELLDLLSRSKRETDILGSLSKDRVGLLLPHTNEQGVQAFVNGVTKRTIGFPISITSGTYPDHLFDNLTSDVLETSEALTHFIEDGAQRRIDAWAKRAFDIVGSLTCILIFSPIMLVTAIAVAASSAGPVIFRQTRVGRRGKPFVLYKFRSMRVDADDRIHREFVGNLIEGNLQKINQGDESRPLYKMSADPRITRVGRFIRKTSVDELPQLFNVLKGEMSLVGPRPALHYEAEQYQSWHLRRILEVRPGITGLWQVEGRSTTSFDEMVRLDLRYIRSWSLWLDVSLLLKTIVVVLRRDGAR